MTHYEKRVVVDGFHNVNVTGDYGVVSVTLQASSVSDPVVAELWLHEAKALRKALKQAIASQKDDQ